MKKFILIRTGNEGEQPVALNVDAIEEIRPALNGGSVITMRSNPDGYIKAVETFEDLLKMVGV